MDDDDDRRRDGRPNDWDVDSALGDMDLDEIASTRSLTSSIITYRIENGRRYHAFRDGQYFMPNDSLEQQGMDLMHYLSSLTLHGKLFRAPIEDPISILEIGTGTGIWAIDVADMFPAATVIATDLSPIQPSWVPHNLDFQIDDCESAWSFRTKFDFIHIRNLSGGVADWPQLLENCYEYLNPGGWLEVSNIETWGQSYNNSLPTDSPVIEWQDNLKQAALLAGRKLVPAAEMADLQSRAGFVDIFTDKYLWPITPWLPGKRKFSKMFNFLVDIELEAMSLRLYTQVLGWPPDRIYTLLEEARRDINNLDYQMYSNMQYVCARKPGTAT